MKKILLILLFFVIENSNSQCLLQIKDLIKSSEYNLSNFENFALNNGYSYNSRNNNYICDISYEKNENLILSRFVSSEGFNTITLLFFKKEDYLNYKTTLESKGELFKSYYDREALVNSYIYEDSFITLTTKTINSKNIYIITLSNQKN